MPVSVRDIARHAGVSSGTVSRVLNGHRGVNEDMRERVLHAADSLGYERPTSPRRALGEAGFLLVVREVEEDRPQVASFWAEVLYGAELEARSVGARLVFRALHMLDRDPRSVVEQVRDLNLSAAVLVGPAPAESVAALRRPNLSLVLVDNALPDHSGPAVLSDNFAGARAAVDHLVSLGHRQIAFIGGPTLPGRPGTNAIHSIWWRALGYRTALEDHGIAVRPEHMENCDLTVSGGAEAAKRLLDGPPFTAIVAANDPTAVGVLQTLNETSVTVPGDVSVVGFDDDLSYHVTPRLTTVHVDTQGMGAAAVRLLVDAFNNPPPSPMVCTLPVQLVVRASSGVVRAVPKIAPARSARKPDRGH